MRISSYVFVYTRMGRRYRRGYCGKVSQVFAQMRAFYLIFKLIIYLFDQMFLVDGHARS